MIKPACIALLLLAIAAPAVATPPRPATSAFWREARRPGYLRARALLRQAQQQTPPTEIEGRAQGRAIIENALARLEIAHRLAPDDPEILFELALATTRWERRTRDGTLERRDDEAARLFEALRELDPTYRTFVVGFELGLLRTRARDYAGATLEYERALASSALVDASNIASAQGNLAEVTMLAGDLERAVEHYQAAEDTLMAGSGSGLFHPASLALARFGRAVALDRLGEHDGAIEVALAAIQASQNGMSVLRSSDVFFEPASELYWYEALAHLALAREAAADSGANGRTEIAHLERALRSFRRFLAEGGADSPWAPEATGHVERLTQKIADLHDASPRRR